MKQPRIAPYVRTSVVRLSICALVMALWACGKGDGADPMASADGGDGSNGGGEPSGNGIDEAVLAKCPQSSTLIETTEWSSCLEGKSVKGIEPFTNKPCELRIGKSGAFEYLRDNALAIAVPERSMWLDASGTYQNEGTGDRRFFLAGIAPDLKAVEGEARVTHIDISLFALDSQDDKVAVRYLDAALASQTYNCTVEAL